MRSSFVLAASIPALVAAQSAPVVAVVRVGQPCTVGGIECDLKSSCYAVNSMQQTVCGNFQAACTADEQCAFNTCKNGFCTGVIPSSSPAATTASPTPSPSPSQVILGQVVPVGQHCTVGGVMCALGASCYAVNSMQQTVCGNFQAQCTSDQQCAFNTCKNGFCTGVIPSSSPAGATSSPCPTSSPSASPMSSASPSPSPSQVIVGQIVPIGQPCTVGGVMCALGASCYAVNSMQQTVCGNFQAQCTSDQQCAFNTCQNGFCTGVIPTSSPAPLPSTIYVPPASTMVPGNVTWTATPTMSAITSTTSMAAFTGAAAVANVAGGAIALVFGGLALAL
ncbi:hypothetical protein ACEQ8H_005995 [Pleosporales sp. CAS-2024a]